jgi:hypothetical protein
VTAQYEVFEARRRLLANKARGRLLVHFAEVTKMGADKRFLGLTGNRVLSYS